METANKVTQMEPEKYHLTSLYWEQTKYGAMHICNQNNKRYALLVLPIARSQAREF
ncbi:hypothetical protein XBP1_1830022 [Xenorhabdus bovienii str. puntauvense]|uniref:Uncharacterized protein n=1 Tax=Xenorhabdus bovienii str. puntauvense TaxID=1398201 RepID=A0A077NDN5_XENBV|nr:hypothetical protein XBP1_1830022 [Xenorhabdus bovienii str. puntauvense]